MHYQYHCPRFTGGKTLHNRDGNLHKAIQWVFWQDSHWNQTPDPRGTFLQLHPTTCSCLKGDILSYCSWQQHVPEKKKGWDVYLPWTLNDVAVALETGGREGGSDAMWGLSSPLMVSEVEEDGHEQRTLEDSRSRKRQGRIFPGASRTKCGPAHT